MLGFIILTWIASSIVFLIAYKRELERSPSGRVLCIHCRKERLATQEISFCTACNSVVHYSCISICRNAPNPIARR